MVPGTGLVMFLSEQAKFPQMVFEIELSTETRSVEFRINGGLWGLVRFWSSEARGHCRESAWNTMMIVKIIKVMIMRTAEVRALCGFLEFTVGFDILYEGSRSRSLFGISFSSFGFVLKRRRRKKIMSFCVSFFYIS